MLKEVKGNYYHYYRDAEYRYQGEYKKWWQLGDIHIHCFYLDDMKHGECKEWTRNGKLIEHCFYINGKYTTFEEIPYPTTPEDRLYFKLKYDLPLL